MTILPLLQLPKLQDLHIDFVPDTFHDPINLLNALAQDMMSNLSYLELTLISLTKPLVKTLFSLLMPQTLSQLSGYLPVAFMVILWGGQRSMLRVRWYGCLTTYLSCNLLICIYT
jgi:hypothetical protein